MRGAGGRPGSAAPGYGSSPTSRERLGVPGEAVVAVGGLELPERDYAYDDGWAERSEAGRLFIDRARMARADFVVDDPGAMSTICERLDGIPFALELAAAQVRLMSLGAIAEGLSDRFHLLVEANRPGPRHRTLLASIEWSCGLLTDCQLSLLSRLSASPPASRSLPPRPLLPAARSCRLTSLGCSRLWSTSRSSKPCP